MQLLKSVELSEPNSSVIIGTQSESTVEPLGGVALELNMGKYGHKNSPVVRGLIAWGLALVALYPL